MKSLILKDFTEDSVPVEELGQCNGGKTTITTATYTDTNQCRSKQGDPDKGKSDSDGTKKFLDSEWTVCSLPLSNSPTPITTFLGI